jgi:hypothetical protein
MSLTTTCIALAATVTLAAQTPAPSRTQNTGHRAEHAMGFDQERTTHHFRIEGNGGTIDVTAKDPGDRTSIDQIRRHIRHISTAFADGDFSLPMFVHDTEPPGAQIMKARRAAMTFKYAEIDAGAQVVIRTAHATARDALHDFLRFQIREHKTGDPMDAK